MISHVDVKAGTPIELNDDRSIVQLTRDSEVIFVISRFFDGGWQRVSWITGDPDADELRVARSAQSLGEFRGTWENALEFALIDSRYALKS
jgi:hypothetical protein